MPVQRRSSSSSKNLQEVEEEEEEDSSQQQQQQQQQGGRADEDKKKEEEEEEEDSDRSPSSSSSSGDDEKDEFLFVKLSDIRKEVQCPICLGIIRKTRTVMECLHRFCRECIDKSMRMGNNECPACRTHCASRRSLRDDPNYDTLIATLYPDIDKFEEKELTFGDEEKTRNKHIQASIAQTFQRQSEALGRKQTTTKTMRKSQGTRRRGRSRKNQVTKLEVSDDEANGNGNRRRGRSRKNQVTKLEVSDDEANGNGNWGGRDSSSDNEVSTNTKLKRCKRLEGPHSSQPSSASTNADVGCHDFEVSRESQDASPATIGKSEVPVWGKGGTRSQTRHGNASGGNGKDVQSSRLVKLVDYLRSLDEETDDEV